MKFSLSFYLPFIIQYFPEFFELQTANLVIFWIFLERSVTTEELLNNTEWEYRNKHWKVECKSHKELLIFRKYKKLEFIKLDKNKETKEGYCRWCGYGCLRTALIVWTYHDRKEFKKEQIFRQFWEENTKSTANRYQQYNLKE